MSEIRIMNRERARRYAFAPHAETSVIISIRDNDEERVIFPAHALMGNEIKAVCPVSFDDVDEVTVNPDGSMLTGITKNDAAVIADFVDRYWNKVDIIIVHCSAGVSRSAGCAAAILKAYTGDDRQVFDNSKYRPNMRVYREVLGALQAKSACRMLHEPEQDATWWD